MQLRLQQAVAVADGNEDEMRARLARTAARQSGPVAGFSRSLVAPTRPVQ